MTKAIHLVISTIFIGSIGWVVGAFLILCLPGFMGSLRRVAVRFPVRCLLYGFAAGIICTAFGLLITLVLPVGMISLRIFALLMVFTLVLGTTVSALAIGEYVFSTNAEKRPYWTLALGIFCCIGVGMVPVIGQYANFLVSFFGLGAIVAYAFGFKGYPPTALPSGPPGQEKPAEALPESKPGRRKIMWMDISLAVLAIAVILGTALILRSRWQSQHLRTRLADTLFVGGDSERKRLAVEEEVDRLERSLFDIEARMWAMRIRSGEMTFEELRGYSRGWLGKPDTKEQLMQLIAIQLKKAEIPELTDAERARLDQTKERIRERIKAIRDSLLSQHR